MSLFNEHGMRMPVFTATLFGSARDAYEAEREYLAQRAEDPAIRFSEALGPPDQASYIQGRSMWANPGYFMYGHAAAVRLRNYLDPIAGPRELAVVDQGRRFADAFDHVRRARKQKARHLCGTQCSSSHAVTLRLANA